MSLLDGLNERQRQAVVTTEGPVMVMAGAGSGKTKVLTTRISYLIDELGVAPSNILAVTFTNKAAREMKERIEAQLGIETRFMWVSTFHSFCARLLRMEANNLPPFDKRFVILDDEDSVKLIKEAIKELDYDIKPQEMKKLISKGKNFTNFSIKDPELNSQYLIINKRYEAKLKENNAMDFDDLIIKTIELFRLNPDILRKYQDKFQYILVDEFQDTNALQYALMFMLSARFHNIFVVGDDFQSIYSFRGAKIENINKFRNDYLEHKLILLEQNYRSTSEILNLANDLILHNPNQIKKQMFSSDKKGNMPFVYHAMNSYDETTFVLDKIKAGLVSGKTYKDFAIMYRANYISRSFEDALIRTQIPYRIYGGLSYFSRKEIKDIVAYLRLIVNSHDNLSFNRVVNEPKRKIGPAIIERLTILSHDNNISLFDAIDLYDGKGIGADNLKRFKVMIESLQAQFDNIILKDIIDILLDETGYHDELKKDEDTYEDRLSNVKELKTVLNEVDIQYDGNNYEKLDAWLSDLALRTDNDNEPTDENTVKLMTYHQAKGLEYDTVFMVATEDGIFPSINSRSSEEIEEERRICYVGITRAKQTLYITCCDSRFLFGQNQSLAPSMFIKDMNEKLYADSKKKLKEKTIAIKPIEKKAEEKTVKMVDNNLAVGDKVKHISFGDGIVVQLNGTIATIAFADVKVGIKKLMANHPSISKI